MKHGSILGTVIAWGAVIYLVLLLPDLLGAMNFNNSRLAIYTDPNAAADAQLAAALNRIGGGW